MNIRIHDIIEKRDESVEEPVNRALDETDLTFTQQLIDRLQQRLAP